jgi:hypothetical protein
MGVIQQINRTAFRAGVWATRLPVTVAERVRGDVDDDWAPALAFDRAVATAEEMVGGLLHDDEMVQAARLTRARVSQLRRAHDLEAEALATREHADAELAERRAHDEQQRKAASRQRAARSSGLEADRVKKERDAAAKAKERERRARAQEAESKAGLEKQDRASRATRLAAEREVLEDERRAVAASAAALDAERQIETTRTARRSRARS